MATVNLGKVAITPKGTWNNATLYKRLDFVYYNGNGYVCIKDLTSSTISPTNTEFWMLAVSKGDKGQSSYEEFQLVGKLDVSELDFNYEDIVQFHKRGNKPAYYIVTESSFNVGLLKVFGDSSNHVLTQIFETQFADFPKTSSHWDNKTFVYKRHYNINASNLDADKRTWSEWQLIYSSDFMQETNDEIDGLKEVAYDNRNDVSMLMKQISELERAINDSENIPKIEEEIEYNYDLDIKDEYGNILAIFDNGGLRTLNFDSDKVVHVDNDGLSSDFSISDEYGSILLILEDGHIRTKNFDSSNITTKKLPYSRLTRFKVEIECEPIINSDCFIANDNSSANSKVYSDNATLYLPTSYKADGEATKLIIFCKYGGSQVTENSDPVFNLNIFNYMLYLGYAVLAVDGMPDGLTEELKLDDTRVVGNYIAVQSVVRAFEEVVQKYNIDENSVFMFGYSQGGHYAQNVADLSGINIKAVAELSPVVSMRYHQWDLTTSGASGGISNNTRRARMNIARLFNYPAFSTMEELNNLEYDASKVVGYDPFTNNVIDSFDGFIRSGNGNGWKLPTTITLDDIKMKKFIKAPLKIWVAENDGDISADVTKVFVKAIKNAGGVVDLHLYKTGGHNIYNSQSSIGTFIENGETKNLYPLAKEIGLWFSKFGGYIIK